MRSRSPLARRRYIAFAEQAARAPVSDAELRITLTNCVAWLELFYISALTWEYIHQHHIRSFDQLRVQSAEVDRHVRSMFPQVDVAAQEIRNALGELPIPDEILSRDWFTIDWSQMVRSFNAIVAECPVDRLEVIGRRLDEPHLSHRVRNAYDALRSFVRRHSPERAEVMRIVGEQYQHGNLRLRDAALLLGMSTSDAIFELEQVGFSRPLSAIMLTETEREAAYQRLRQRRLQQVGSPLDKLDLVERDVIASERIEGVDARAWIRRR